MHVPARAAAVGLTLRTSAAPDPGDVAPPALAGFKRGLGTFFLHASDTQGQPVHQFAAPLSVTVHYTPEQLQALQIAEPDLTLFWYDEQAPYTRQDGTHGQGQWVPLPTTVDRSAHTATVTVDHFSAFQISDGSSPSAAYLPNLQSWQVGLATGAASWNYPIDVPAGPAGIKPQLALSYNSAATDGSAGLRPKQQAGWAGKGFSLDTGAVALNKPANGPLYYTLAFNGQSYDLRGTLKPGYSDTGDRDPTHWDWKPTDESFIRVSAAPNGASWDHDASVANFDVSTSAGDPRYGRGAAVNGSWLPRYTWQVWSKDGTRYDFSDDLWWGWNKCASVNEVQFEAYKWLLHAITDSHGNTITYTYNRQTFVGTQLSCDWWRYGRGTVDRDAWPATITWGGNPAAGAPDRYKVEFVAYPRSNDTQYDGADNQYFGSNGQPRETQYLAAIKVSSNAAGTWSLVRQYNFDNNHYELYSDQTINGTQVNTAYPKLTLWNVRRVGNDGTTALPATIFYYGVDRGTGTWANADWNRVRQVDNGQGGTISFSYEQIGAVTGKTVFNNHRRVTSKTLTDGRGHSYSWTYQYSLPELNTLGWQLAGTSASDPNQTQQYPNSAALYYNKYWDPAHPNDSWLAHAAMKEFRGHNYVKEIDPTGAATEHWFYQGDVGCAPTTTGGGITGDSCFLQLRDREFLKGKEYLTKVWGAASTGTPLLKETQHSFGVSFYDYSSASLSGVWHAFSHEDQLVEKAWEGGATPVSKTTNYAYDITENTNTNNGTYGNLSRIDEFDQTGARVRITKHYYAIRDDATVPATGSPYITDRTWATVVWDTAWNTLAYSASFYDRASDPTAIGTAGDQTRTCKLYAPPPQTALTGTLACSDTTYTYDAYGNRTTETTYAGPGSSTVANSVRTWGAAGNGSVAQTTTTTYDGTFHVYPTQVTQANGLVETATYDYRMGTLTSVTDANTATTTATYDGFGRIASLTKPGDVAYPTKRMLYYDNEQPVRYALLEQDSQASDQERPTQQMYDGLGREIQIKRESQDGGQTIVVDKVYDGLGRVVKQSQPRYSATVFWGYTPQESDAAERWTATSYDGLGRTIDQAAPDGATTATGRWAGNSARVDANGHRTEQTMDVLGRLTAVRESTAEAQVVEAEGGASLHAIGSAQGSTWLSPAVSPTHGGANYLTFGPYQAPAAAGPGQLARFRLAIDVASGGNDAVAILDVNDATANQVLAQRTIYRNEFPASSLSSFRDFAVSFDTTGRGGHSLEYRVYWLDYARLAHDKTVLSWAQGLNTTQYSYSPLDLLTGVTDAQTNSTSMTYDSLGRKLTMRDPDMGSWSYGYDVAGNLTNQTDAKGQSTAFGYDALNRLTSKVTPALATTAWSDSFDARNTAAWSFGCCATAPFNDGGSNVLQLRGTDADWSGDAARNGGVGDGQRVTFRFKVDSPNTAARIALEANDGGPYRRFGVIADNGGLYAEYMTDGATWNYPGALLSTLQSNTWYVLSFTLDDARGFTAEVVQEGNPAVRGAYRATMPGGKGWRFHAWTWRNAVYLDDYRETSGAFSDSFDTRNSVDWAFGGSQTVPVNDGGANVRQSTGTGVDYNTNAARSGYSLTSGWGLRLRFKLTGADSYAHLALEANDATYRRFGVLAASGKIGVEYNTGDGVWGYPADLIPAVQLNTWYVLTLSLDDAGGFTALVYQESAPGTRGAYRAGMPGGKQWRFHDWIYRDTAYLDDYREEQGAVFGYDAGANGKGQQTSQSNPNATTTWQYDARGRATQETWTVAGLSGSRSFTRAYDTADRLTSLTYPSGETLSFSYDAAWRPTSACTSLGGCYATNASYTALDQPSQWALGNSLLQQWTYTNPAARLQQVKLTTAGIFDRSYSYDTGGNVQTIADNVLGQTQSFTYDHRDRLTQGWTTGSASGAYNETYQYDTIGNLTSKAGVSYSYAQQVPWNGGPHAVKTAGATSYTYDANGNMLTGGGRSYAWTTENQPTRITGTDGVTEAYAYDAAGTRVLRTRSGVATVYLGGLVEEDVAPSVTRTLYQLDGQVVAQRDSSGVTYLHSDRLGSISVATTASGGLLSSQSYMPWGDVRLGGIGQTSLNYTGQRRDGTGLLYYNARYYDPALGRFVSADSVVPGASGNVIGRDNDAKLTPLTVDFHEPGFAATVSDENAVTRDTGFWFQLSDDDRGQARWQWGPLNPQALNRYSYVLNNPLRYVDPTGHIFKVDDEEGGGEVPGGPMPGVGGGGGGGGAGPLPERDERNTARSSTSPSARGGGGRSDSGATTEADSRFVSTPNGRLIRVPRDWVAREAENGRGIVYQRPGAVGNADSIRIMEPTSRYPHGYVRYYNSRGQPLDVCVQEVGSSVGAGSPVQ